jgi:hypothetical protein
MTKIYNRGIALHAPAFFCALLLFVYACSKPKTKIPPGILTQKEMIPILVDIHIAQAAAALYNTGDTARRTMTDYMPYILKIHEVEKAFYDSSLSFYTQHPEIMQEMYDEVINELSKKQGEVTSD